MGRDIVKSYTASHWGIYEVERSAEGVVEIKPYRADPDPSPIGLHQLDPAVTRLRVRRPAIRRSWLYGGHGASTELRGREPFVEVEWDHALDLVAAEAERVRSRFGCDAIFGGSYGWSSAGRFHHAQSQVHRFLNALGGYVRHMDSYSLGAARVLMPHIVTTMDDLMKNHTSWEVMRDHCQLFVAFGGVPAKNAQIASGGVGTHKVRHGLRAMAQAGTRFVNVSPVGDDLDTGLPFEWIRIRPNTDTAMMLALAFVLRSESLESGNFLRRYCVGYDKFEQYLLGKTDGVPKDPRWAEQITGVSADRIVTLAREMAGNRTMINTSWALQRASHGEQPFWMVVTLASMLGQIGLPGGGFGVGYGAENTMGSSHIKLSGPTLSQLQGSVKSFIPVARIADMLLQPGQPFSYNGQNCKYPDIKLIYWAGGNPFHHHQDLNRLLEAWRRPDSIVVHEQFWTPTAKLADVVLPATTSMERNDIGYATCEGHFVAMKKMIEPIGQSRSDHEIFSALSERLGVFDRFTEGRDEMGWLRHLYDECRDRWATAGIDLPNFDEFWQQGIVSLEAFDIPHVMLQSFREDPDRNPLKTPSGKIEIFSQRIAGFGLSDCPGHAVWREPLEWLGAVTADRYPLHLISDQPKRRLHSQLDSSPHSCAGKRSGREVVSLNLIDARSRGIAEDDLVEIFNDRGRCLAVATVTDQVMEGVVRLSTGAWFDLDWETGVEKHGNPNVLTLDVGASRLSQGCSAQTCLVDVRRRSDSPQPVTAFTLPEFA